MSPATLSSTSRMSRLRSIDSLLAHVNRLRHVGERARQLPHLVVTRLLGLDLDLAALAEPLGRRPRAWRTADDHHARHGHEHHRQSAARRSRISRAVRSRRNDGGVPCLSETPRPHGNGSSVDVATGAMARRGRGRGAARSMPAPSRPSLAGPCRTRQLALHRARPVDGHTERTRVLVRPRMVRCLSSPGSSKTTAQRTNKRTDGSRRSRSAPWRAAGSHAGRR